MKLGLSFTLICILIVFGGIVTVSAMKSNVIGKTLTAQEAEKKWGKTPFDAIGFKKGTTQERAKMASDILAKQAFKGAKTSIVREQLGDPNGYFWSDRIPAYLLNEGSKPNEEVWQLVFLPGANETVSDVVINKNCCE